jgi:hypothetical protein
VAHPVDLGGLGVEGHRGEDEESARANSTIVADTSTPVTWNPAAVSRSAVGRPVPEPMSSTRAPAGSRAVSQAIAASCSGNWP